MQEEENHNRLPQLRAEFREKVLGAVAPFVTEDTVGSSLDITRLFPGHAYAYLKNMQKKAGAAAAQVGRHEPLRPILRFSHYAITPCLSVVCSLLLSCLFSLMARHQELQVVVALDPFFT